QMHFIDRHGRAPPILAGAVFHVLLVGPAEGSRIGHDRSIAWSNLGLPRERVSFEGQHLTIFADDLVFVDGPGPKHGNEHFPNALAIAHRVPASIPLIPRAHHRHTLRIRRPDG